VIRETPEGRREAVGLRWGLIPFWAKEPSIGSRLINARAEGLIDKPAFRAAFRRRRCLVPADGFFEWRALAGRRKQPYYVRLASGEPFAMAGLWEQWRPPEGELIATFTIVTTTANEALRALHDRMPAIVAPADYDEWLSSPNPSALLGPWAGVAFEVAPIGTRVNDVRNDDPGVLQPLPGV
jgi:putative SOS response-associated peptidase YedK